MVVLYKILFMYIFEFLHYHYVLFPENQTRDPGIASLASCFIIRVELQEHVHSRINKKTTGSLN